MFVIAANTLTDPLLLLLLLLPQDCRSVFVDISMGGLFLDISHHCQDVIASNGTSKLEITIVNSTVMI